MALQNARALLMSAKILAVLAIDEVARAAQQCGDGWYVCDRTNPSATCSGLDSYKDCFYVHNGACAAKDPATFYFPQCHEEFGWASDATVYSQVNGPIQPGLVDSTDLEQIGANASLPPYLRDGALLAQHTAAGGPLLAGIDLGKLSTDAPGLSLLRRSLSQLLETELGIETHFFEAEGADAASNFSCAAPNGCSLEYAAGTPASLVLDVNGMRIDTAQLDGVTVSLEGGAVPTLYLGPKATGRELVAECHDEDVRFQSHDSGQVQSLGCAAADTRAEVRAGSNLSVFTRRRPSIRTWSPQTVRLVAPGQTIVETESVNLIEGGDVKVVGAPGNFDLEANCRAFEWHDDAQGFVPGNRALREGCAPSATYEWTFRWEADRAIVTPACVSYEVREGCWSLGVGAPQPDPFCICAGGSPPVVPPPVVPPPVVPPPEEPPPEEPPVDPDAPLTAENCAESIGLPPEYDLTQDEMVELCDANGGKFCPNHQYETLCMHKAKGRGMPDDPEQWVHELIDYVERCEAGDEVACPVD